MGNTLWILGTLWELNQFSMGFKIFKGITKNIKCQIIYKKLYIEIYLSIVNWNCGNHGTFFLFNTHECYKTQIKNSFDLILSFDLVNFFWKWIFLLLKNDFFIKFTTIGLHKYDTVSNWTKQKSLCMLNFFKNQWPILKLNKIPNHHIQTLIIFIHQLSCYNFNFTCLS
jgi:hypothetical protein